MQHVKPLLAKILDQVVEKCEKECINRTLADETFFSALRKSGLFYRGRKAPYKSLRRKLTKKKKAKHERQGQSIVSIRWFCVS